MARSWITRAAVSKHANRRHGLHPGAGTLHALGPGLLVCYEVQQTPATSPTASSSWNGPPPPGSKLHIDESLLVLDLSAPAPLQPVPPRAPSRMARSSAACLALISTWRCSSAETSPVALDPGGQSFQAVTLHPGRD